jgi:hypothetical protein
MRYAKFMLTPAAAGAALILSSAQTARADFSGPYAPANWTLFNSTGGSGILGNGFVDDSAAPVSITLFGSNGDGASNPGIDTDYTIAAVASGLWSFDWSYDSVDSDFFDNGGYLLNGTYTQLADNGPPGPVTGNVSIFVSAGDVIGFRVHTVDNTFGPGELTITNFVAPVPAPGALALLALAAVSGRSRRRRC